VIPIKSVTARVYRIPTDAPEGDGTCAWDSTTMTVIEVSGGGHTGIGWTYGAPECGSIARSTLAKTIIGRDLMDVSGCWEQMVRGVRNNGRQGAIGYAISAMDVALWDLKARTLGVSLQALLGSVRDTVPVYASGGFTTYSDEQLARQVDDWLDVRSTAVKIKIGESWGTRVDRDLARIVQARAAIGPDVALFVDANGGYTAKQAIRLMERAVESNVSWFEEPVSSDNLAGLAEVRAAVSADVAAGEYCGDIFMFRKLCETGAVDVLQADATRCGGITEWLRVAAIAAAFGLELSGHCAPNLHAHVASAIPNLRHLEWFHDHDRIERLFFDGALKPRGGVVRLDPDAVGNGFSLRAADVKLYLVAS
jgi:L-alanine-DL-glutamate epimerase-like enolase superfamily enzyme